MGKLLLLPLKCLRLIANDRPIEEVIGLRPGKAKWATTVT